MSDSKTRISVQQGDDPSIAVLRIGHRSTPIIAGVLQAETDQNGEINKYYLNCLVHYEDSNYEGWIPSGCVSTILKREEHYVA